MCKASDAQHAARQHPLSHHKKPAKPRDNIGQFNDTLLGDIAYCKDAEGQTYGYLILVDEGTDWTVAKFVGIGKGTRTAAQLFDDLEVAWIDWAGPPDVFVVDGERGFSAEEFVVKVGRAGIFYDPSAAYAPWQKGKVERKIDTFKSIVRQTVIHSGIKGPDEMRMTGVEAASAINQRPSSSGISAAMMLFGQKLTLWRTLCQW